MLNRFLNKLDKVICRYFGLSGDETDRPRTIKFINNDIYIINNVPFQRHISAESLCHYSKNSINKTNKIIKQKIGVAAGKAIAKNLIISFEEVKIREL